MTYLANAAPPISLCLFLSPGRGQTRRAQAAGRVQPITSAPRRVSQCVDFSFDFSAFRLFLCQPLITALRSSPPFVLPRPTCISIAHPLSHSLLLPGDEPWLNGGQRAGSSSQTRRVDHGLPPFEEGRRRAYSARAWLGNGPAPASSLPMPGTDLLEGRGRAMSLQGATRKFQTVAGSERGEATTRL